MKKSKHYTIPIFIPFAGCPFRCVFCDQNKITSYRSIPTPGDVSRIAETFLKTIPGGNGEIEIGFFGGTFTALPFDLQRQYLDAAKQIVLSTNVSSIRLSTRPDSINQEILSLLKEYPVKTIELGIQSLDDNILLLSGRGHTAKDSENASQLIKAAGFRLGHQIMLGLPGDNSASTMETVLKSITLGADDVRIYPVLVIEGTKLAEDYRDGKYTPLTLDQAVDRAADILPLYEKAGVNIIRIGLHPSEELASSQILVAGPFHPSFKELVMTELWRRILEPLPPESGKRLILTVSSREVNYASGYRQANKKLLEKKFSGVIFRKSDEMDGREYRAVLD